MGAPLSCSTAAQRASLTWRLGAIALPGCHYWKPRPHVLHRPAARQLLARCCAGSANGASARESFYVTTPLYYVNAEPHMGGAYSTIAADTLARFQRLQGKRVRFVTGTDEHGEKIAAAAAARGAAPQEHCNAIVAAYKELWGMLDISFDSFIRTTDPKHEGVVAEILDRVWQAGDIYKANYEGWYCVGCEAYLDDEAMDEQHKCLTHRAPCQQRAEENYFFRLSKYQAQLEELISQPGFVQPAARRNEVAGWVNSGLRDFSISRAAVAWGIPIPRDPAQTVYVWFDALLGYLSGLLPEGVHPSQQALAQHGWPADVHVIGKDILRFHAVYWPAMLMAAGLPVPKTVFGHGFLTKDGLKMGKSLGNILEPKPLVAAYGADAVRFYFMKEVPLGQDGDFREERFRDIVNAYLANSIGNLANRTLNLLKKNYAGALPSSASNAPAASPLRALAGEKAEAARQAYERLRFSDAAEAALALSGRGNQYLEETAPWTAFKKGSDEDKAAAAGVLVEVLEAVRITAVLLAPITPGLSRRIYAQLGLSDAQYNALSWQDTLWGGLQNGHQTPKPEPVFARLEGDYVTEAAPQAKAPAAAKAA